VEEIVAHLDVRLEHVIQILISLFCGAVIGSERELRNHPAGLRTIMLITSGSCVFMIVGSLIAEATHWPDDQTQIDPGRLASYVIAGIGFLGAGPIVARGQHVHGLTSAATIWSAAGIGLLIGLEHYGLGLGIALGVTGILMAVLPLSDRLSRRGIWYALHLRCPNDTLVVRQVLSLLEQHVCDVDSVERASDWVEIHLRYRQDPRENHQMFRSLRAIEGVYAPGTAAIDPLPPPPLRRSGKRGRFT
jgi:putative Mg2+ transporter-C (MgtC) family protein